MHFIFWRLCILSFQHFWTERFNFSWHLINICSLYNHFCSSFGDVLLVLAALSQNLSVHDSGNYVLSLVKRIHVVRGNTLLVFYFFVWASCKWKKKTKKKQYYTFNNSSILQMLGKDHILFLKKILIFFLGSVSAVYIIPTLALRFFNFYTIAITRLFNVITYNNNITV